MKNDYEIRGDVTAIILSSPKYGKMETIISTKQFDLANEFMNTWYAKYEPKTNSFYAVGNMTVSQGKRRVYGLHQWLCGLPGGLIVDHKNHDTLNNTVDNLRILTRGQNRQNLKGASRSSKSGARGVTWNHRCKRWQARMWIDGEFHYIGQFETIEEADDAAIKARKDKMRFA